MKNKPAIKLLILLLLILPTSLHADHIMVAENWIVDRASVEVSAEEYDGKLVLNVHFAKSHHKVCLRILYREKHNSPQAKKGLIRFLAILRDPKTTSISDAELGPRLNLTFDRFLGSTE